MKRSNKYIDGRIPSPTHRSNESTRRHFDPVRMCPSDLRNHFDDATHALFLITYQVLIVTSIQICLYSNSEESIISVQSR